MVCPRLLPRFILLGAAATRARASEATLADSTARRAEQPRVACGVCELAVREGRALFVRDGLRGEEALADAVDALCSAKTRHGQWLTKLSLERVSADSEVVVVAREESGECNGDCLVAQRACRRALDGHEDEIVRLLLGAGAGASAAESEGEDPTAALSSKVCERVCNRRSAASKLAAATPEAVLAPQAGRPSPKAAATRANVREPASAPRGAPTDLAGASAAAATTAAAATSLSEGTVDFDRGEELEQVVCQVCGLAVEEGHGLVERQGISGDEDAIQDAVDALCSVGKLQGRWLTKLDLEQNGAVLSVLRQKRYGECRSECLTVQRACARSLRGSEERFVKLLAQGSELEPMKAVVCKKACIKTPRELRGVRRDEVFQPMSILEAAVMEALDELQSPTAKATTDDEQRKESSATQAAGGVAPAGTAAVAQLAQATHVAPGGRAAEAAQRSSRPVTVMATASPGKAATEREANIVAHATAVTLLSLLLSCRASQSWQVAISLAVLIALRVLLLDGGLCLLTRCSRRRSRRSSVSRDDVPTSRVAPGLFVSTRRSSPRDKTPPSRSVGGASVSRSRAAAAAAGDSYDGFIDADDLREGIDELAAVLAAQEERLRGLERLARRATGRALKDAVRAQAILGDLRARLERCGGFGDLSGGGSPMGLACAAERGDLDAAELLGDGCTRCGAVAPEYRCRRCRGAWYCNAACQREHWALHRAACRACRRTGAVV